MANFPRVQSLDYATEMLYGKPIQSRVVVPDFQFQYSPDFEHYKPCGYDFRKIKIFENEYVMLRPELAAAIWESLKMKYRYVLAAAHDWHGERALTPLPQNIPEAKIRELHMIAPPVPDADELTINFFAFATDMITLRVWIERWQQMSHQLSAWIAKAKERTIALGVTSWVWPEEPCAPTPYAERPEWDLDKQANPEEWTTGEALGFTTRDKIKRSSRELINYARTRRGDQTYSSEGHRALGLQARIERRHKRPRDTSPDDYQLDHDIASENLRSNSSQSSPHHSKLSADPSELQLIKWQPPISQTFANLCAANALLKLKTSLQPPSQPAPQPTNDLPHLEVKSINSRPSSAASSMMYEPGPTPEPSPAPNPAPNGSGVSGNTETDGQASGHGTVDDPIDVED